MDDGSSVVTFNKFYAEGGTLEQAGSYQKAIDLYSKALEAITMNGVLTQAIGRVCLCARSKCYLQLGNHESALKDAEAALADDKTYIKGLAAKAEALYFIGNFENALVFFHRGHKLRPEMEEFRLGIQKSREAINNSIGTPESCKLVCTAETLPFLQRGASATKPRSKAKENRRQARTKSGTSTKAGSDRTVKQLLGELYADKQYLEDLMKDTSLSSLGNRDISTLVSSGIQYLDKRADFWRQQKPIYARKNEQKQRALTGPGKTKPAGVKGKDKAEDGDSQFVADGLRKIDDALEDDDAERAIKIGRSLLRKVEEKPLADRQKHIATVCSALGSALLEANLLQESLEFHMRDLTISRKHTWEDSLDRALGNVGRVKARMGLYTEAIEVWTEKATICANSEEKMWLNHEIGRCHYELQNFETAVKFGEESLTIAKEHNNNEWQLNSSVLVAQGFAKLSNFAESLRYYEDAFACAEKEEAEATQKDIRKAMAEVKQLLNGKLQRASMAPAAISVPVC